MTWLGLLHLILVIVALGVGAVQFLRRPGTRDHRRRGYLFVGALLVSDVIVFGIYEDSQTPGIFHLLAVISLVSLIVATALVRGRTTLGRRMAHAHVMLWSFGGVVAAGLGQGQQRGKGDPVAHQSSMPRRCFAAATCCLTRCGAVPP